MRQFLESGEVNGIRVRLELVPAIKLYDIEHSTFDTIFSAHCLPTLTQNAIHRPIFNHLS